MGSKLGLTRLSHQYQGLRGLQGFGLGIGIIEPSVATGEPAR